MPDLQPTFKVNGKSQKYDVFKFASGELNIRLISGVHHSSQTVRLTGNITSSDQLIELMCLVDAIRSVTQKAKLILELPYLPYSRDDRRMVEGQQFGLKMFAKLINSLEADKVVTWDAHSDVAACAINNLEVIPQTELCGIDQTMLMATVDVIVSPDTGAFKKSLNMAQLLNRPLVVAEKIRNVTSGEITGTEVFSDDLQGKSVAIFDDICQGGLTFIKLAEVLKQKGVDKIYLVITHGFYDKGLQPLYDAGITEVITLNDMSKGN